MTPTTTPRRIAFMRPSRLNHMGSSLLGNMPRIDAGHSLPSMLAYLEDKDLLHLFFWTAVLMKASSPSCWPTKTCSAWLPLPAVGGNTVLVLSLFTAKRAMSVSAAFATWAPRTYNYYKTQLDKLFNQMTNLPRIFSKSVFPSAAFNIGPKVYTRSHRDLKNCPFGWCTVQALGRFDPTKGGHLIVWELGLAIEFPAGSTILLPSATLTHSNISVAEEEERASFTQFCHGGLFRWVDYDFQTEKNLQATAPGLYAEVCRLRHERWTLGLSLLSTMGELRSRKFEDCSKDNVEA